MKFQPTNSSYTTIMMQNIYAFIASLKKTIKKPKNSTLEKDFVIRDLKKRTNSTTARKNLATLGEIKATLCEWKKENDEIFSKIECQFDSQITLNYFNRGSSDYIERSYSVDNLLLDSCLDEDRFSNEERNVVNKRNTDYVTFYHEDPLTTQYYDEHNGNNRYCRNETEFDSRKHYLPISPNSDNKIRNELYKDDKEGTKKRSIQFVDSFEDLNNKLSNTIHEGNSVYINC